MTDLRQAAQQALDAYESTNLDMHIAAITALKAALEQQQAEPVMLNGLTEAETNATASVMGLIKQAEPVAWRTFDGEGGYDYRTYEDNEDYAAEWAKRNPRHVGWVDPLYTTPPQRKPLTDEFVGKVVRSKQPNLDIDSKAWKNEFAECKYWLEAAHSITENK